MSGFVYAIIVSRSKEDMEVLSNKEIYVLLQILTNKAIMNNSTSILKLESSYTKKELTHLSKEIDALENYSQNVLQIRELTTRINRKKYCNGYNIRIFNAQAILNYSTKYVENMINDLLVKQKINNKFLELLNDFYQLTKDKNSYIGMISNNLKYMPVFLFAYIYQIIDIDLKHNNDIENKSLADGIDTFFIKAETKTGVDLIFSQEIKINNTSRFNQLMFTLRKGNNAVQITSKQYGQLVLKLQKEAFLSEIEEEYSEENLIENLKKDFRLTIHEINTLRACKYLMDIGEDKINNKMISDYLDKLNYPIDEGGIKQVCSSIRNKCALSCSEGGVHVIIYVLERQGYIIPALKSTIE